MLEADLRHAELIVQQLGLSEAKTVTTPGVNIAEASSLDVEAEGDEEEDLLPPEQATMYRAIGARCNYLQPDRPDIQYATKEVCRRMCRPTIRSMEMLKRIGRYLKGRPRLIWNYAWQNQLDVIDVHCDANWAGCRKSRKSTSGGTVEIGCHLTKTFYKTQSVIAKSSGESELYGVVRASTDALGISTLLQDFGEAGMRERLGIDASAAMGIVQRRGMGYCDTWRWTCCGCKSNRPAGCSRCTRYWAPRIPPTKNVPASVMEVDLDKLNLKFREGRAAIAQQLQSMREVATCGTSPLSTGPSSCTGPSSVVGENSRVNNNNGYLARLHFNNCKMARGEDRSNVVEEAAAEAAKSSKEEAAVKAAKSSKAEERHVDSWTKQGQGGRWTRAHRSARRALFTPYKVAGGPAKKDGLKKLRVTRGRYFSSGKTFKIIDDWTVQSHAHRLLEGAWIGTTDFRENVEYIDDDSDEGSDDGDRQAAGEVIRAGINSLGIKQRDTPEKQILKSKLLKSKLLKSNILKNILLR